MANFARILPDLASYVVGLVLPNTWFNQVDGDRVKTINATDGSTHAPSTQINIGGAGLNVTGPLAATALTATNATINGGAATFDGSLTVDGATANVTAGGALVMESGSQLEIQSGADLTLGANVWPEFSAARVQTYTEIPRLLGMTDNDGFSLSSHPAVAAAIAWEGLSGTGPCIHVKQAAAPGDLGSVMLSLPRLAPNATVVSATIWTTGFGAFPLLQTALFTLCRRDNTGTVFDLCSPTPDVHDAGNWLTSQPTILTATTSQTNGFGHNAFFLRCTLVASAGTSGYRATLTELAATHDDLRR